MKIQCDYCKNTYEDTLSKCPSCGAPNPSHNDGDKRPKTIEDLKKWYEDRHLPPYETTRFFIGINYTKPKAFGIYQDENGEFIVYKNKADGSRAIRYKGKDEQYAVNELWQKLKDEIVHQKNLNSQKSLSRGQSKPHFMNIGVIVMLVWFCIILIVGSVDRYNKRNNGYYKYSEIVYYNDSDNWYYYDDDYEDWITTTTPVQYDPKYHDDYYMGKTYSDAQSWDYSGRFSDIRDNAQYQYEHQSSSDDSDYDWGGSDSWDSGGTDWDSDW